MQAVIIHGICDEEEYFKQEHPPSKSHWIPWLQEEFIKAGIDCQTPEMPTPYAPLYEEWRRVFEKNFSHDLKIIVGHSAGCGFALKWLSQNSSYSLDKLVLVAPYCDPLRDYGDFIFDAVDSSVEARVRDIHLLYSLDEPVQGVEISKDAIMKALPKTHLHLFDNKGHFCFDEMGTSEFPELKSICLAP